MHFQERRPGKETYQDIDQVSGGRRFQEVPLAELSSVEGGGKISFKLGRIGIALGNAIGGESGGAVGWSIGNAIGGVFESFIDIFT